MIFQSSLSAELKSTQDLIVFCHGAERVLVPLPKSYEDAQKCAKDLFHLAGDIEFETTDLHGSVGEHVRIHSTAWEGIIPILHFVFVKSPDVPMPLPRRSEVASSAARPRLSSQKKAAAGPSAAPIRLQSLGPKSPPADRQLPSVKKGPFAASNSRTDTSTASSASAAHKEPQSSTSKVARATPKAVPAPVAPSAQAPAPASTKMVAPVKAPAPSRAPEQAHDAEEEEEEEEIQIVSPTKKRVNRPRILSDYGLDEPEEQHHNGTVHSDAEEEEEEEEYDELEDTEFVSAAPPPSKTPSSQARPGPSSKQGFSSRDQDGSLVQLDAMPSDTRKAERTLSPKVKVEKGQPKPAQTTASQSEDAAHSQSSQGKPDESFLIMIEYNDDPESRSLFKTRGRHMVSKVLMQACRTFGLEPYYNSARLVLLVEDEEEGEVYRSVCNRTDTMAQAGAEPNARFVVELVDEDNDE